MTTTFYDLDIEGAYVMTSDITIENQLTVVTGTLDHDGFTSIFTRATGVPIIAGGSAFIGPGSHRFTPTGAPRSITLGGAPNYLDVEVDDDGTASTVTLTANANFDSLSGASGVLSTSKLDCGGFDLDISGDLGTSGDPITFDYTNATVTVTGDWNSVGWTLTRPGSTVRFDGSPTITTNGMQSQSFVTLEWHDNATITTLGSDIYVDNYADFIGNGDAGTHSLDVYISGSIGDLNPWRNSSASNDFSNWTGEVVYDYVGAAPAGVNIDGFYPTLRVRAGATSTYEIDSGVTAEDTIIFGDGSTQINIDHNMGAITAQQVNVLEDADLVHAAANDCSMTLSGGTATLVVLGRFDASSATNQYDITADDIVISSPSPGEGVFNFRDPGNNGSSINLGVSGRLTVGADTDVSVVGASVANRLAFTGNLSVQVPDIFRFHEIALTTTSATVPPIHVTGDQSTATVWQVRGCDINAVEPLLFDGAVWLMTLQNRFVDCEIDSGVDVSNASRIWFDDCLVTGNIDVAASSVFAVHGTIVGGNSVLDLYGEPDTRTFGVGGDMLTSIVSPNRATINIRDPNAGSTIVTVAVNQTFESWVMEPGTNLIHQASSLLILQDDSTLATSAISGTFRFTKDLGQLDIIEDVTVGGDFEVQVRCDIVITDGADLIINGANATLDLSGPSGTFRVDMTRNNTGGTRPSIIVTNADSGAGAVTLNNVTMNDYGDSGSGNAALQVDAAVDVVVTDCFFTQGSYRGIDIAANATLTLDHTAFWTNSDVALRYNSNSTGTLITDVSMQDNAIGIEIHTTAFAGKIKNLSSLKNTSYGMRVSADVPVGTFLWSVLNGNTNDIDVVGAPVVELSHVILSDKVIGSQVRSVSATAGWNVIAYNYNRTNTKEVRVYNDLTVDSTFQTLIHMDEFSWDDLGLTSIGDKYVTQTDFGPLSDDIGVDQQRTYYVSWDGTLVDFTVVLVDFDQSTATVTVTSGGTFATTADTFWIRFSDANWIAGSTFYNLEVREDNSAGDLVFKDNLINKFKAPNSNWEFKSFGIHELAGTTTVLPYGDGGYHDMDMEIDCPIHSPGDRTGLAFGLQDPNNYYEVVFDGTSGEVQFNRIVAGVSVTVDDATTFGGTPINIGTTARTLRVVWDGNANTIDVYIDGTQVIGTDWTTSSSASLSDSAFDEGILGLVAEAAAAAAIIDNLLDLHGGLFLRDTNLILNTGVTITVESSGIFDLADVTVNASESVLNVLSGGTNKQNNVTWLGGSDFDESVDGPVTVFCPGTIEVTTDIIFGGSGSLDITGAIFKHATKGSTFKINTSGSTVQPPIVVRTSRFPDVVTTIRPLDSSGPTYELNPIAPPDGPGEIIEVSGEPTKELNYVSNPTWGRPRHRNIPKNLTDDRVTVRFFSYDDMCLYGKCRYWMEEETQLELISPQAVLWGVKIVDVKPARQNPANLGMISWLVDFVEFR